MGKAAWDTIVVGAGVFGLSVAFVLVRGGRRVLVLDRRTVGAGLARFRLLRRTRPEMM